MKISVRSLHFGAYFLWASLASFAFSTASGGLIQALAIVPIAIFCLFFRPQGDRISIFKSKPFLLICLGGLAACLSALLNDFTDLGLLRYLALIPSFMVMIPSGANETSRRDVLQAFALGGTVFCAAHAGEIDPARVFDPKFRIEIFLSTNGVGFIAGMTLLTHAILLGTAGQKAPLTLRLYHWSSIAGSGLVLFLTRSRTAAISCAAGLIVLTAIRYLKKSNWKKALFFGALASILTIWGAAVLSSITEYYSLFDKYRGISNATNRTEIWSYMLDEIIAKNLFWGVGPGQHAGLVLKDIGFSSAHNGVLMYLAEIGIISTLPYLMIFWMAMRRAMDDPGIRMAVLPLLVAGGVESMAETMFFSTGNVGSLLFLFALAVSAARRRAPGRAPALRPAYSREMSPL